MRIGTWNVNSLRVRQPHLLRWLDQSDTDVVCLQETKLTDDKFPAQALRDAGYEHLAWHGQPTYNGVAIISRHPLTDVQIGMGDDVDDPQARVIAATIQGIRVIGVYCPNGQQIGSDKFFYKLAWYERLRLMLDRTCPADTPVVLCGDFNVAPDDIDVWDPFVTEGQLLCHPDERNALERVMDWGLEDSFRSMNPFSSEFSWWDYRAMGFQRNHGVRIDHLLLSDDLMQRLQDAVIWRDTRGWEQPSDHAPVTVDL